MNELFKLCITEEQANEIAKNLNMEITDFKDKCNSFYEWFEYAAKDVMKTIKPFVDWFNSLDLKLDSDFKHNFAMAKYSNKKRTRKKYAKKCFNH